MPRTPTKTKSTKLPPRSPAKIPSPTRRKLKIYAFDPMLGRSSNNRVTIDVAYEPVTLGPSDGRIEVIDYDHNAGCYYEPVNLNDPALLIQGGLDPSEADPRFHQQMVYAVTKKVVENFDVSLGRRLSFKSAFPGEKLRLYPHAFYGENAYFLRSLGGVAFGYFRADKTDPGPNMPGQMVFTCLSHDIIAHEVTHAMIARLRERYDHATNRDVPAFHEGFADIVAIFQHFSFPDVLVSYIQQTKGDLRTPQPLIELALQFGYATGSGRALRTSLDKENPKLYGKTFECHDRGSILVAAVFDAFFSVYEKRIQPLVRLATNGSGTLPAGEMPPQLVSLLASEASSTADSVLKTCIRAFEYLPAVDISYGDFLRALVTADRDYNPMDRYAFREAIIEAFRKRGIYAYGVISLAEESLLLDEDPDGLPSLDVTTEAMLEFISGKTGYYATSTFGTRTEDLEPHLVATDTSSSKSTGKTKKSSRAVYGELRDYANNHRKELDLHPDLSIAIDSFHPNFRIARDGRLLTELVAVLVQQSDSGQDSTYGGVPTLGGTTIVFRWDGSVRFIISKPLKTKTISSHKQKEASHRESEQLQFVSECDQHDAWLPWSDDKYEAQRIAKMTKLSSIHRGI